MDWLKSIVEHLPLDFLSELLARVVILWSRLVQDVPENQLPLYAYVGGSVLVLLLWLLVARILPRPISGISWIMLAAVLFTPGTALGDTGQIAPACVSVVHAILMKDIGLAFRHAMPILAVMIAGLFIGGIWQLLRSALASHSVESDNTEEAEEEVDYQNARPAQLTTLTDLNNNAASAESHDMASAAISPQKTELLDTETVDFADELSNTAGQEAYLAVDNNAEDSQHNGTTVDAGDNISNKTVTKNFNRF